MAQDDKVMLNLLADFAQRARNLPYFISGELFYQARAGSAIIPHTLTIDLPRDDALLLEAAYYNYPRTFVQTSEGYLIDGLLRIRLLTYRVKQRRYRAKGSDSYPRYEDIFPRLLYRVGNVELWGPHSVSPKLSFWEWLASLL